MNRFIILFFISIICSGCSYRAWYNGFQMEQQRKCYANQDQGSVQQCLDKVNNLPYDDYNRQREESLKQSK